jgi:hypothetical protein
MTPDSLRVKQWRDANKDRYNARMKEYMVARRKAKREVREALALADAPTKKAADLAAEFTVTTIPYHGAKKP